MIQISVDSSWCECFPGARVGFLEARNLPALARHPALDEACRELELELRAKFAGMDRKQLRERPVMRTFDAHFRPFGKTYHVLLQLESVVAKGRPIANRLCAVTALFMAELRHGLVAAGHDLKHLNPPFTMAASRGGESYRGFGDSLITLPAKDMLLRGERGILSSVLYGPEQQSPITPSTTDVLYTIYSPADAPEEALEMQLKDLTGYLRLYAPGAEIQPHILPVDHQSTCVETAACQCAGR
jgi:DNA/RNA-binding domain of Phe-tRNA-synthetase-like protein